MHNLDYKRQEKFPEDNHGESFYYSSSIPIIIYGTPPLVYLLNNSLYLL